MAILTRTLWNAKTASQGGDWVLDAMGGVLRGIIYVDRKAIATRNPGTITAYTTDWTSVETEVPDFTVGQVTISRLEGFSTQNEVAFRVTPADGAVIGLWQVDALYTTADKTMGDYYTKEEVDVKTSEAQRGAEAYADRLNASIEDKTTALGTRLDTTQESVATIGNSLNALTTRVTAAEKTIVSINDSLTEVKNSALRVVEQGNNANGYWVKFSNGAMKQWGQNRTSASGNATQFFPTAFPAAPKAVFAIQGYMTAANVNTSGAIRIDDAKILATSFQLQLRDIVGGGTVQGNASTFFWFAEYWPDKTFKL